MNHSTRPPAHPQDTHNIDTIGERALHWAQLMTGRASPYTLLSYRCLTIDLTHDKTGRIRSTESRGMRPLLGPRTLTHGDGSFLDCPCETAMFLYF